MTGTTREASWALGQRPSSEPERRFLPEVLTQSVPTADPEVAGECHGERWAQRNIRTHIGRLSRLKALRSMKMTKNPVCLAISLSLGCASEDDLGSYDSAENGVQSSQANRGDPSDDEADGILNDATVYTLESNHDGKLSPGERTMPEAEFNPKATCSQSIEVYWSACLTEVNQYNVEVPFEDVNETPQCGDFRTIAVCDDTGKLVQGETDCLSDVYCDVLVTETDPSMRCGWRITQILAKNRVTGETLERFDPNDVGFELLPIVP